MILWVKMSSSAPVQNRGGRRGGGGGERRVGAEGGGGGFLGRGSSQALAGVSIHSLGCRCGLCCARAHSWRTVVTARASAQPASAQQTAATTPERAGRCCNRARAGPGEKLSNVAQGSRSGRLLLRGRERGSARAEPRARREALAGMITDLNLSWNQGRSRRCRRRCRYGS